MADSQKLIERLRAVARKKSAATLGTDFGHEALEDLAADALEAKDAEIERLQTLLGDCRSERKKMAQRLANFERGSKKAEGWRKKT